MGLPARFLDAEPNQTDRERFRVLLSVLPDLRTLIDGREVLDFGASYGLSICALLEFGARQVIGIEPDRQRVERGVNLLQEIGIGDRASLLHVEDTRRIPFSDGRFDTVLANAVLEHIPQPREAHIREIWRLVKPSGHLIINETPNKYLPQDFHTTGLWFVPWLPERVAFRYAIARRKWTAGRDWKSSGWRGLGYFELAKCISGFVDKSPQTRVRHRLLNLLRLPPQLFDPYPTYVLKKC